uniref:RBR-type E3 ubiquitin transferase n=1 Tax=Oncorhynchus kisutch TaxID=8019 RepID=A0A8C7IRE5_ONCKI
MLTNKDEKSYDPGDRTLKFVNRQDDISKASLCLSPSVPVSFVHSHAPLVPRIHFYHCFHCCCVSALDDIPETLRAEMSFGYAAVTKSMSKLFTSLKQLKGPGPHSDQRLHLLQNCPTVALPQVHGVTACPSMRACPTCGALLEHDMTACKNLLCPRCEKEFCFVCLKLKSECMKTSSPYKACSAGVAPRQTSIPTWSGN